MPEVSGPKHKIQYLQLHSNPSFPFLLYCLVLILRSSWNYLETKHITFMENYSRNAVFEGFCLTRTLLKMDSGLA